ncbi:MAG: heparan-alpha-glucosaminide N-acetyltransferase domain-containing protein, partial [Bryobacteraceae bacterium]
MSSPASAKTARLAYLDWMRGLAAVVMIQGHAFHSFTRPDLRTSGTYVFSQFVGGMPPAIFLFLVGVTLAFLMDSRERRGVPPLARWVASLRRAGYLFGLAFLFRLQLWVFAWPNSPWTDLLKVDILNAMGLAVAVLSPMALLTTAERARLGTVAGLAIAGLSPLVSQLDWTGWPPLIKAYLAPDYYCFAFFPWASFVGFGLSAGSILKLVRPEQIERLMQWGAVLGFALILGGQ